METKRCRQKDGKHGIGNHEMHETGKWQPGWKKKQNGEGNTNGHYVTLMNKGRFVSIEPKKVPSLRSFAADSPFIPRKLALISEDQCSLASYFSVSILSVVNALSSPFSPISYVSCISRFPVPRSTACCPLAPHSLPLEVSYPGPLPDKNSILTDRVALDLAFHRSRGVSPRFSGLIEPSSPPNRTSERAVSRSLGEFYRHPGRLQSRVEPARLSVRRGQRIQHIHILGSNRLRLLGQRHGLGAIAESGVRRRGQDPGRRTQQVCIPCIAIEPLA